MRVGILHTVPGLAVVFHDLLLSRRADLDIVHVVDPALLAEAVAAGQVTDRVRASVAGHLDAFIRAGAQAVLVTCSSIGEAAEDAAAITGVPLTRVDTAMARTAIGRAMAAGASHGRPGRVAVLATLAATLGPTQRLVERFVPGPDAVTVTATVVPGAADARAAGDATRHDALIAAALRAVDADVTVLAQASMAPAAGADPRVLTSPESGAAAFVDGLAAIR
ncbi:aspartate/glutamate racemase family protein [Microbacterium terrisoli]|uniref:aspartate/glutamate racemase family protein n=1 Tax=Microbacterium terrisoli TaxID=3242192 RepID=UPI00280571B4|nr:aspartate/glutamate racemase family protein [Microbacterium protaetiae]